MELDRCATCGVRLPERSLASPDVRYCQDDWWREQLRRFDAGEPCNPHAAEWFTTPRPDKSSAQWLGVRAK